MKRTGFFITLEGPEGSGKSTQSRRLAAYLKRRGCRVVQVRDPGSTALGRALRAVLLHNDFQPSPLLEALLFIGARMQLVEERVRPALKKGAVVVCDRFHDSTVVYQGYAGGLNVAWLDHFGYSAVAPTMPQLTILLDLPAKEGFARLKRGRDRMERKAQQFHRQVRQGYLRQAKRRSTRIVVVDGGKGPERVTEAITCIVEDKLGRWLGKTS